MSDKTLNSILKTLKKIEKRLTIIETNMEKPNKTPNVSEKKKPKKVTIVKSGTITLTKYNNACVLTGDTFDKKHIINKEFKGRWNPAKKGWIVKLDVYDKLYKKLSKCTTNLKESYLEEDVEGIASVNKIQEEEKQEVMSNDYGFLSDSD